MSYSQITTAQVQVTGPPIEVDWDICEYYPDPNPQQRTTYRSAEVAARMGGGDTPCSTFDVTYTGFTPQAEAAFQYAVDIWSFLIESDVTIKINAQFTALGTGVLGSASAASYYGLTGAGIPADTSFPSALADKRVGSDIDPAGTDINANFSNSFPFYFGTDANPGGQYDFVSVVLHELGHGLGFAGLGRVDDNDAPTQGILRFASGRVSIWDRFIENGSGNSILTFADPSAALLSEYTGNNLFCNSAAATAENGGANPRTYAPTTWAGGSSYSHWNEGSYAAGNINSLMTPQIGAGEAIHDPGPVALGFMEDMGWTLCVQCADGDGDGFTDIACGGTDCDDNDPNNYPGNTEVCDGQDNNCDGQIDEGFDSDGDGVTTCQGDCDDNDPNNFPGNTEVCDGLDNNCDGQIDEGCTPNDGPETAIQLSIGDTVCETIIASTNEFATDSMVGDTSCTDYDGGDVWFYIVAPVTGEVTVEVTPSVLANPMDDSVLSAYSTDSMGAIVAEIDCNDNTTGLFSKIELAGLIEGDIILFRVNSYDTEIKGPFNICAWSPSTLGVIEGNFEGFDYYPNPVDNVLHLKAQNSIDTITIYNMLGQKITTRTPNTIESDIDMSELQTGVYFVNVRIGNTTRIISVIKK
jgi:hypothetical protein